MEDALILSRLQFAMTAGYHYIFPQLSMGLALLVFALKSVYMRNGDEKWNNAARFWGKIFAVTFHHGRRYRNPDGVPIRNQLVCLLRLRRRHHRPNPGYGRRFRLFPGVCVS